MKSHQASIDAEGIEACTINWTIPNIFYRKWTNLGLFCLFLVFSNKQSKFYNKLMWKMSIQYQVWDSNSQPSDYESSTYSTRRELLPLQFLILRECFQTHCDQSVYIDWTYLCNALYLVPKGRNSVTRLGDLLDFGQLFKAFGNN